MPSQQSIGPWIEVVVSVIFAVLFPIAARRTYRTQARNRAAQRTTVISVVLLELVAAMVFVEGLYDFGLLPPLAHVILVVVLLGSAMALMVVML